MGNAPIAQVDAMVIEQAVLTRNLQMVASAQGVLKIFRLMLLFGIPQQFSEIEFFGCYHSVDPLLMAAASIHFQVKLRASDDIYARRSHPMHV